MKRNIFTIQMDGKKLGEIKVNKRSLKLVFVNNEEKQFETLGEIAEFIDNLRDDGHHVVIHERW
jgi:3-dehydroquinate synthase class II